MNGFKRIAKREAARGGARVPHKTICGKHICGPEEYKSLCGISDRLRYTHCNIKTAEIILLYRNVM